jgi:hypothetical protein
LQPSRSPQRRSFGVARSGVRQPFFVDCIGRPAVGMEEREGAHPGLRIVHWAAVSTEMSRSIPNGIVAKQDVDRITVLKISLDRSISG